MAKKSNLLLTSLMSLIALAGCQDNGERKIELRIGFWPEKQEIEEVAMYNTWKAAFEKDYPQYQIVGDPYTYSTETIGQKFLTGSLPTVFQTWFTEPSKLVSKGFIRSIDDQLKEAGFLDVMDPEMKETLTFEGKVYGIPRDGYGLGLLINVKTLGENGILPEDDNGNYLLYDDKGKPCYPTTFEEIYEVAQTLQEYDETKGILICSANKDGGWQFSNIAWNYGATLQYQDQSGKWISSLDCDEAVEALSWIQKMKNEDLLLNSISVVYNDWYDAIGSKVAMAIVGSDVLHLAQVNAKVSMDDLAFVPMPSGDNIHHYSLYGGTPYVFSKNATDEQVEGILKFFDYIGRSPNINDISKAAMEYGNEVALKKNQPIIPKIRPWINEDYVSYQNQLDEEYVTVDMYYYEEFFNSIAQNKHKEVENLAQEMYEILDSSIQNVLNAPETANPRALLQTANAKMQALLDENVN